MLIKRKVCPNGTVVGHGGAPLPWPRGRYGEVSPHHPTPPTVLQSPGVGTDPDVVVTLAATDIGFADVGVVTITQDVSVPIAP